MSEFSEINALFQRVDKAKPNPADIEKLREVLTKYPALSQLGGNLARQVETQRECQIKCGNSLPLSANGLDGNHAAPLLEQFYLLVRLPRACLRHQRLHTAGFLIMVAVEVMLVLRGRRPLDLLIPSRGSWMRPQVVAEQKGFRPHG